MGTSKSYSGSGGKAGKDIREEVGEWLESLPQHPQRPEADGNEQGEPGPTESLPLERPFQNVISLLRPRGGGGADGPGGGGGAGGGAAGGGSGRSSGGPQRSAARSSATAGRAAAAAYAFNRADAATLDRLGLNYAELVALGSPVQVSRRIVEMVCGPRGDSTIDDTEQRLIAAEVAEWVISQQADGYDATPEDVAKHAIASIVLDTLLTEVGELVSNSDNSALAEEEIKDAVENWVENRAQISIDGATEEDFSRAIETGIEGLRKIVRGGS